MLFRGEMSVAGPGVALGTVGTRGAIHGAGCRVEVPGFDGSPGVFDGFDDPVGTVLADVDIERLNRWRLCFGQHEKAQPDFPVRHHAFREFAVEQQL